MSPGETSSRRWSGPGASFLCGLALGQAAFLAFLRFEISGPSFPQAAGLAPAIALLGLSLGAVPHMREGRARSRRWLIACWIGAAALWIGWAAVPPGMAFLPAAAVAVIGATRENRDFPKRSEGSPKTGLALFSA